MPGRLAVHVSVARPDNGQFEVFGPGDTVPEWAAAKITNPDVWAEPPTPGVAAPPEKAPVQATAPEPPPRGGPGSGAAAWRAYAKALGAPVGADAGRDEIIDELRAEGHRID